MNFSYSEEQTLLADSVQRFLRESYDFETYRAIIGTRGGYSPDLWRQFTEFGWLGLAFDEGNGGLGFGSVELMMLAEQFGRHLCVEPYLANMVLAGQTLARLGSDAQKQALLTGLINGSRQISLAHAEVKGRYNPAYCETRADMVDGNYRLNGVKSMILNAPNADQIIVLARTGGAAADTAGLGLFVIDREAEGVSLRSYPVLGGGVAAELRLDDVQVPAHDLLGKQGQAYEALEDVIDLATAFTCAEAYGALQTLMNDTLEYLKARKQFGQSLASFQVLQHRLVDMFIEVQQTQSMILMTSMKLSEPDRKERQKAVSACKAYVHKASKFVAQQAVQLHGGIGVTEELRIGHFFRRLTAFGNLFGDRAHHLHRFSALCGTGEVRKMSDITAA